jgi:hypothetical protein
VAIAFVSARNPAAVPFHSSAVISETGKPFSACVIAAERIVSNGTRPNLPCSADQPATAPGTVTEWMPVCGIDVMPRDVRNSIVAPAGDHPLAFSPCTVPVDMSWTMANRSPPTPFIIGATTPMTALAAITASTACPPRASTTAPAWAASGFSAATTPRVDIVIERACQRLISVRT